MSAAGPSQGARPPEEERREATQGGQRTSARRARDLKLCGLALLVMAMFAWIHLFAIDTPWLRRLELAALDAQIRLRGPLPPGPETVIVVIDDETIAELGRWPVPRRKMAELITALHHAGAKVIGGDVLFADPEPAAAANTSAPGESSGDAALARAFGEARNVVLPFAFEFGGHTDAAQKPYLTRSVYTRLHKNPAYRPLALKPTGVVTPLPALAEAAALGHMLVAYDVDRAPRYEYPAIEYDLDYYPSMAIRIAQLFLDVPWSQVRVELGRGISIGPVFVPTDPDTRVLVNYLGPSRTFPTYRFSHVLAGRVPTSVFRDRVVLVGADALGLRDTFQSPFTAVMPGVERLATVIDSILHERHLRRPEHFPWLEAALMLAAALALGVAVSRLSLATASLLALSLIAAIAVSQQITLSRYSVWQAGALPILAIVLTFIALSLYRYGMLDRERRHIRRVFQRYLAPGMVDRLANNTKLPELGGELRDLTVLFCDVRGFTALSERLDPAILTRVVNDFFNAASEAILEHGGTIDKFVGDAIMAFWNAPIDQPDHAALACRAALRILEKVDELNETSGRDIDLPRIKVGVGINTGLCTVGNFGSSRRFDYSAIGDAVNVAARIEGENKTYGTAILLGPETAARVAQFATLPIDNMRPRGRADAIEIHALIGDDKVMATREFREARALHLRLRTGLSPRDAETMHRLIAELKARAPAGLRSLYDAFALRDGEGDRESGTRREARGKAD